LTLVSLLEKTLSVPYNVSTLFAAHEFNSPPILARIDPVLPILDGIGNYRMELQASQSTPLALIILHPAKAHFHIDFEEPGRGAVASGALVIPGAPALGLEHRAAWAAMDEEGNVQQMQFSQHSSLLETIDIAVLGSIL
jgi:hypothetical protein